MTAWWRTSTRASMGSPSRSSGVCDAIGRFQPLDAFVVLPVAKKREERAGRMSGGQLPRRHDGQVGRDKPDEQDIKRWTAKRRAALVIEPLPGDRPRSPRPHAPTALKTALERWRHAQRSGSSSRSSSASSAA
jgi:hypothetical protein